jgi:hypothetical protein
VIDLFSALEATALAQHLKAARWTYPLVNAGHILGIALLVGTVIPMDVAVLSGRKAAVALLRPWAVAGFLLAAVCGALLFITQASDYAGNAIFQLKFALLALLSLNAVAHLNVTGKGLRRAAIVSLVGWPVVLVLGRLVGFS